MKFYKNSNLLQKVRWYNLPSYWPVIGIPTQFSNPIWLPDKIGNDVPDDQVGENQYPSTYNKGSRLPFIITPRHFCGELRQWQDGSEVGRDVPLTWLPFGISTCCLGGGNATFLQGGIKVGGAARFNPAFRGSGGVLVGGAASF